MERFATDAPVETLGERIVKLTNNASAGLSLRYPRPKEEDCHDRCTRKKSLDG